MRFYKNILFILLTICVGFTSTAQTRKQLEAKRKKLKTEIRKVNKLLFEAQKKEKNALEDLRDINKKISVREEYIKTINLEASALSKEIKTNKKQLDSLNKKLTILKADYADMIFKSYKSKSQQSKTMFLLSSQNFYQAYKRLQYMKQYTSYRKKQGEEIELQSKKVEQLNDSLLQKKHIKDTLLTAEKEQKEKIEKDKKSQEKIVSSIKKKEKKYRKQLQKKIREQKRINDRIDKIINDAIARSRRGKKKGTKKSKGFLLTPEAKALATRFEKNKGKLPWPLEKALVTRKFGTQKHKTMRGIVVYSPGIHLATEKGAEAKAVFKGEVLSILVQSEGKKSVVLQHGNYITAYHNLEKTYIKKGDKVSLGQKLGKVYTNKTDGKTNLIFVISKNTKRLNPSSWLLRR